MRVFILLLTFLVTVVTQAASIDWSVAASRKAYIYGTDGVTAFGKTDGDVAYLVLASYADDIKTALANGTFSSSTKGVLGAASAYTSYGGVSSSTATSSLLSENTEYNFVVLYVNGDLSQYIMSDIVNGKTSDAETIRDVNFSQTSVGGVGWKSSSGVPEPTSGLLLLVGGAMLALRRKQK